MLVFKFLRQGPPLSSKVTLAICPPHLDLACSVSNSLESLKWPALELRRKIARLSFFHKIIHNLLHAAHSPSSYITSAHTPSISI